MCVGVSLLIFKCSKAIILSISLYFSLKVANSTTDNEFEAILHGKNHQGYKVECAVHALSLRCHCTASKIVEFLWKHAVNTLQTCW